VWRADDESGPPLTAPDFYAASRTKKVCGARFSAAKEFVVLAYFLLLQIGEFIASVFAKDMDDLKLVKVILVVLFIQKLSRPVLESPVRAHPIFWSSGSVFRTKVCPP
jgi:hypothetical protein